MFNNKKIKRLNDELNSIPTTNNLKSDLNADILQFPAKIKSATFNSVSKRYDYTWNGVNIDGSINSWVGGSSNAQCLQEFGVDMTDKSSLVQADDIVNMFVDNDGYKFSVSNSKGNTDDILDLTHPNSTNDTWGWKQGKKTINDVEVSGAEEQAVKVRYLTRQYYSSTDDKNYEYYVELTFTDKGILDTVKQVVVIDGFLTTLHQ